jgi:hypothetical protein
LDFLKDRFQVKLDAEDTIVSYLYRNKMLLKTEEIKAYEPNTLIFNSKNMLDFLMAHKAEIDDLIQDRRGYIGKQS